MDYQSWYNRVFHNPPEKIITIALALESQKNVVFRNYTCNHVPFIEQAMMTY